MKILLLEDSIAAGAYAELLRDEGHEVAVAMSAHQAYKKLRVSPFEIILIDGGANDIIKDEKSIACVVREEFPQILRICYTATTTRTYLDDYMEEYDAVVSKMDGIQTLFDMLNKTRGQGIK
ncbi:MAG: response regulator [Nanoarchaeota archaeon]|nr:response regulator [Nanoarchaeota archaeon]